MFPKFNYLELPYSVEDAANMLKADLSLRDRMQLAAMDKSQIHRVHGTVGDTIVNEFKVWDGNEKLLQSCIMAPEMDAIEIPDPSLVIVLRLWGKLRATHRLRVVK